MTTEPRTAEPADHRGGHLLAGRRGRTGQAGRVRVHGGTAGDRAPARRPRRPLRLSQGRLEPPSSSRGASTITRSSRAGRASAPARIETEADVDDVIALMRLNYERVVERHGLPAETAA